MDRTDIELIQAFRAGDATAADELVQRHLPRVRNLVFQLVLNNDVAEDLTQDVFARAFRSLDKFRGQASLATWLHRITVNVAYRFLQTRPAGTNHDFPDSIDNRQHRPDAGLIETEVKDQVTRALGRLSPSLRTAIVLTVMQGLTAVEAAEIESCSVGTMYWRIHEARRKLRDDLKDRIV